jgi:purine-binding chemotaxis protein CheW
VTDQQSNQYILFTVAGTTYALPSRDIAHVDLVETVTRVPNAAPFVDGVVFSRGQIVPAVNVRARFGFDRAPFDVGTRFLVTNAGGRAVGLLVDSCREFVKIEAAAIHPAADALGGASDSSISGIATVGDRMIVVLDLDRLVASNGPILAA